MRISEAKEKAEDDEVTKTLLEYIKYLEFRVADLTSISEAHKEQFGEFLDKESYDKYKNLNRDD